ncbi:MAG: 16S rRNA (cytosine(1402)-N(4))-methyltransferase RsmH [Deltaproteobacteria bacterium]
MIEKLAELAKPIHKSVMAREAVEFLRPRSGGIYVDATLGLGGHTEAILEAAGSGARVIGFDVDDEAIGLAKKHLLKFTGEITYINRNFSEIDSALESLNIAEVDGIIADLGMSSFQLERSGRGFSFQRTERLDMRMDSRLRFTAYDLVNEMDEDEIGELIENYGEEKWARKIAYAIVKARRDRAIETTTALAEIVSRAIPQKFHPKGIHAATRTFQALRISVNNELDNLELLINKAEAMLADGARLVIISFHSLEDRIVKNAFRRFAHPCVCPSAMPKCGCGRRRSFDIITRSPDTPSEEETAENPRARSAKMRVAEKTAKEE